MLSTRPGQARGVSIGDVEEPARLRRDSRGVLVQHHVQCAQDRRERRAQLVAHGSDELGLAALYVLAIRDVGTGAGHAQRRSVFAALHDAGVCLDPLPIARRRAGAVLDTQEWSGARQRFLQRRVERIEIVGVHQRTQLLDRGHGLRRGTADDPAPLLADVDLAGRHVPVDQRVAGAFQRQLQAFPAAP